MKYVFVVIIQNNILGWFKLLISETNYLFTMIREKNTKMIFFIKVDQTRGISAPIVSYRFKTKQPILLLKYVFFLICPFCKSHIFLNLSHQIADMILTLMN